MDAIGSYSVVRRLDPGGGLGGEAYLAVRAEGEGSAGLSLLVLVAADPTTRTQADHSLAALSNLRHPATAPVLDHFDHDGKLALVLEHDDGLRIEQIQERLQQEEERLTDVAVFQIAHQLLAALAEAHEASDPTGTPLGLVHGHLGPDVTHVGWDGRLRILGMGLHQLFADDHRSDAVLAYRPPEHGSQGTASSAGDLYAAGAIIWSLLTGRRPPGGAGRFVPLARVRSDLSPALSDAIDLTLAPVPEQRQVTARQLVELIERELPAVLESAELRWNIEIFQALSLFTPSTSPPPSTRPIDFQPKARPRLISRHPAPEISAPPATVEIPTLRRPAGADGTSSPATREDWPRPLDELDVPTMEPSTRRRPGRDDAADDDDLSAADEPRTHVMERPDFDAMKRPGPTLVSPSSDDRDDDGALAPVAPPDADLSQPAVVPRVKTHTLVSESSPPRDEVSVTTAPLSPAGAAPAGHTPAPGASAPAATPTPAAPTPPPAAAPAATAAAPGEATVAASRPLSTPQGVPRRSKLPYIAMAAVALIGGATLGWFVLSRNDAGGETAAETDSTASPGATTQASAPATSKAAGSDAPAAPSAPAGATSAAPRAAASGSAALATDAGDDLSGLLSYEGYLVVQSSTKADVYVQGVRVGETNTRIKSRCYRRFVRLKDGASDAWLTTGQPVQIECMKVTRVRIEP